MKAHPTLGRDAIANAQASAPQDGEFFDTAKQIIYSHHEKWNGSGYPQGLTADAIPIPARLMALADVYDALICRRVYKAAMSHEQAIQIIVEGRGKHFDPDVVDAFLALSDEFQAVATKFADSVEDLEKKAAYFASSVT
jgi:putative two-component system response regulator